MRLRPIAKTFFSVGECQWLPPSVKGGLEPSIQGLRVERLTTVLVMVNFETLSCVISYFKNRGCIFSHVQPFYE